MVVRGGGVTDKPREMFIHIRPVEGRNQFKALPKGRHEDSTALLWMAVTR